MPNPGPRRLRSEYLKTGCKECKRRKIKCDEFRSPPLGAVRVVNAQGRELCWQCTRLKKECEYPLKGEKVARVLMKILMEKERKENAAKLKLGAPLALGSTPTYNDLPSMAAVGRSAGATPAIDTLTSDRPAGAPAAVANGTSSGLLSLSLRYTGGAGNLSEHSHLPALPYGVAGPGDLYGLLYPLLGQSYAQGFLSQMLPQNGRPYPMIVPASGLAVSHNPASAIQPGPLGLMDIEPEASHYYDHSDLTVLATDLNNLVSDMMYEANPGSKCLLDTDSNPNPPTPTSEETSSIDNGKSHINLNNWIPRNVSLGYLDVREPKERLFLQEFYLEFSNVILPFNSYDRSLQGYFNPVRDILLKCASKEPFLLAAILAQGARSSFSKTGAVEDEEAYCHYLLRCLKLLGPALGHASSKNGLALTSNIEAVLLTVLLLTSSNAANAKQNWRPHLKGAKDLLLKHTTNRSHFRNSKVLIFCKYWFMSFELLAGLGLKLGGTLHLEEELDLLLNLQDPYELLVLSELGLVLPNGFNLIVGYHYEFIHPIRDLIKLLNKVRRNKNYVADESSEYVRLLSEFHHQLNTHFVNKKAILDLDDFPGRNVPEGLLLEPVTVDSKPVLISWMDLSHQLFGLAATITVLTDFLKLPYDSPQVQNLTVQLTTLLSSITKASDSPRLIKYSIMMIQWPLLVGGLNCVRESDKYLVTNFFSSAAKLGAGSAGHSMNRLRRVWHKHACGNVDDSGDESLVDIVNY